MVFSSTVLKNLRLWSVLATTGACLAYLSFYTGVKTSTSLFLSPNLAILLPPLLTDISTWLYFGIFVVSFLIATFWDYGLGTNCLKKGRLTGLIVGFPLGFLVGSLVFWKAFGLGLLAWFFIELLVSKILADIEIESWFALAAAIWIMGGPSFGLSFGFGYGLSSGLLAGLSLAVALTLMVVVAFVLLVGSMILVVVIGSKFSKPG